MIPRGPVGQHRTGPRELLPEDLTSWVLLRFWLQTRTVESGCIEWTGATRGKSSNKYGAIRIGDRKFSAHRLAWVWAHGVPIPDGLTVDHVCGNYLCVLPDHLETIDGLSNSRRSPRFLGNINSAKTHCPQGHAYGGDNLKVGNYSGRFCRECSRQHNRDYRARNKLKEMANA